MQADRFILLLACASVALGPGPACGTRNTVLVRDPASPDATDAIEDGGDADAPFQRDDAGTFLCTGRRPCACNNSADDDADEVIDEADPDCTGPFDDDEASFETGIPTEGTCRDCFFDDNPTASDDGCRYDRGCFNDPSFESSCGTCATSSECESVCESFTPNGCDCFGCCEFHMGTGVTMTILLDGSCSSDDIAGCSPCIQSTTCTNPCDACEVCPGLTVVDLPDACGGTPECDESAPPCNAARPCADPDTYCRSGCCLPFSAR